MKEQMTGSNWRGRKAGRLAGALGLLLALVLLVSVGPVYAQDDEMPPAIPHFFAGTVSTSNGQTVPGGTWVEAWIEGVKRADTPVTSTGTYALFVTGNYSDEDKIVSFTVGGVQAAETYPWKPGGDQFSQSLNLTIPALPDGGSSFPLPCFIATAAYGTDNAQEIDLLREFREVVLLSSDAGAELVSLYYRISPPIAEVIWQQDFLRTAVRAGFICPVVAILNWSHALWSETD
jgi:hypothetical protein